MNSENPPAYTIFEKSGGISTFVDLCNTTSEKNVIFFGEIHNNPISHWLRLELLTCLQEKGQPLQIGAEMMELDRQEKILTFLRQKSKGMEKHTFQEKNAGVRYHDLSDWPNFKTDYLPMLVLAHQNYIPVYATNLPRTIARQIARNGLAEVRSIEKGMEKHTNGADSTRNVAERSYLPPADFVVDTTLPWYSAMKSMFGNNAGMSHGHGNMNVDYLIEAQAAKDYVMARTIAASIRPGHLFVHANGRYHSDHYGGIVHYLKELKPGLKVLTISTVEQDNLQRLDSAAKGLADFIIVTPSNMTKTH